MTLVVYLILKLQRLKCKINILKQQNGKISLKLLFEINMYQKLIKLQLNKKCVFKSLLYAHFVTRPSVAY